MNWRRAGQRFFLGFHMGPLYVLIGQPERSPAVQLRLVRFKVFVFFQLPLSLERFWRHRHLSNHDEKNSGGDRYGCIRYVAFEGWRARIKPHSAPLDGDLTSARRLIRVRAGDHASRRTAPTFERGFHAVKRRRPVPTRSSRLRGIFGQIFH
jgi:hypothetical protein